MCGIVGILGHGPVAGLLSRRAEAARISRLSFQARIATIDHGRLDRRRASGKLRNLEQLLAKLAAVAAELASATRAGRRMASRRENNAHPHASAKLAVVHNGIIENFRQLVTNCAPRATNSPPTPTSRSSPIS